MASISVNVTTLSSLRGRANYILFNLWLVLSKEKVSSYKIVLGGLISGLGLATNGQGKSIAKKSAKFSAAGNYHE